MCSPSLGRPKWEGALGPKVAQRGEAPWGSFLEASPLLGAALGEGKSQGAAPRAAPSSKLAPLPLPL